jgi:hypothetical protein
MTRDRIAEGLELLTLQLANGDTIAPPEGHINGVPVWTPHEWAYIKGIASNAIWTIRKGFVTVGQA